MPWPRSGAEPMLSPIGQIAATVATLTFFAVPAFAQVPETVTREAELVPSPNPLPDSYGIYIVEGNSIEEMIPQDVTYKVGLAVGGSLDLGAYVVDGLEGQPLSIASRPLFVVYEYQMNPRLLNLARLEFVQSLRRGHFNKIGTDCRFLPNVYGGAHCSDVVPIRLWMFSEQVPLSIDPVEAKEGMYHLAPRSDLTPGRYALFFRGALHGDAFAARGDSPVRSAHFLEVDTGDGNDRGGEIDEEDSEDFDVEAPVTLGATINGTLGGDDATRRDGSYYEAFPFQGQEGMHVIITLASSDFDAYLTLVSPSGSTQNNDDKEKGNTDSSIDTVLDESGEWIVVANTLAEGETGDYRLTVSRQ